MGRSAWWNPCNPPQQITTLQVVLLGDLPRVDQTRV